MGVVVADECVEDHGFDKAHHLRCPGSGGPAQQFKAPLEIASTFVFIFEFGHDSERLAEVFLVKPFPSALSPIRRSYRTTSRTLRSVTLRIAVFLWAVPRPQ